MDTIKVLGICGSLRKGSTNKGLLRAARDSSPEGVEVEIADISKFPFYNADIEIVPEPVQNYFDQLRQADALLLACPEYNYSLAPALKNALDWASKYQENKLLSGKPAAILGSGGGMGTGRAQYHLRQVCVYLNVYPLNQPEVFAGAFSGSFDDAGNLIDEKIKARVVELLTALKGWTTTLQAA